MQGATMNKAPSPTRHHIDIISDLYGEIVSAFTEAGAVAPDINDLYHFDQWRYCHPVENKHKHKIGFVCCHDYVGDKPRVRVTVHSFAQSGCTVSFNSFKFERRKQHIGGLFF